MVKEEYKKFQRNNFPGDAAISDKLFSEDSDKSDSQDFDMGNFKILLTWKNINRILRESSPQQKSKFAYYNFSKPYASSANNVFSGVSIILSSQQKQVFKDSH